MQVIARLRALDQVLAVEKHECPACGAQAEWNPAKQKLVCPFCGTESPYRIDRDTGKVAELDLAGRCANCRTRRAAGRRRGAACSARAARR